MRLRHAYRTGGDDFVEETYGVRFFKDDKNLHRQIDQVITEHEETLKALAEEEKTTDEKELLDIEKFHKVISWACEGLGGVSVSEIANCINDSSNLSEIA